MPHCTVTMTCSVWWSYIRKSKGLCTHVAKHGSSNSLRTEEGERLQAQASSMELAAKEVRDFMLWCLQEGHIEGQVGCRRIVTLGTDSYVQELTALDDEEHIQ